MCVVIVSLMCHRGILPAVSGQFVSHGLRTFAYEGSLNVLKAISGGAAELQVRISISFKSFTSYM